MINKCITYLFDDYRKQRNASLFKNLLYIFILLKCFFWILNFDILFGENALSMVNNGGVTFFKHFAFILYYSNSSIGSILCISALVLFCGLSLFKRSYFFIDFFIYLIIININVKIWTSLTAGDPLLANLCFLSIFFKNSFEIKTSFFGQLKVLLHNISFIALITQVCIVYFYSALAKWFDVDWLDGNAIHLVNMTAHYSGSFLMNHANTLFPLSFVLSYIILLYQTLFPILIWFKKIKKPFLYLGIIMHLYIAFVMGLFFFGLIMAVTYVLFYDFEKGDYKHVD